MSVKDKTRRFLSYVSSSMRRPVVATITDVPLSRLLLNKKVLICKASNGFGETAAQNCSDLGAETVLIGMDANCVTPLSELVDAANINNKPTELKSMSAAHTQINEFDCVLICLDNCTSCDDPFKDASDCAYSDQQKAKELYFMVNNIICKMLVKKRPVSIVFFERTNRNNIEIINEAVISGYTKGLAKELRSMSIRVNHVIADISAYKGHENNIYNLPKEDVVNAALPLAMFLLSDVSACITGQCIRQHV